MNQKHLCASPAETQALAAELARDAVPGTVYALIGELGCGKTLFAKAFAAALGIAEEVTSPTFTLLEEYKDDGRLPLYHFDLYRIENDAEFDFLDFDEYWEGEGISLIEWADRAADRLPHTTRYVRFYYVDEQSRRIEIEYPGS